MKDIVGKNEIKFLYPHPSIEAKVVAENIEIFKNIGMETCRPKPFSIIPDKLTIVKSLKKYYVPSLNTFELNSLEDIDLAFSKLGSLLWIRAVSGAGRRFGLKVDCPKRPRCGYCST
ncbi:MAG: hypothetical protein ACP5IE_08700 [Infirmifilum sp.]